MNQKDKDVSPEFTPGTKRKCAERVNFLCSNPDCPKGTSGPNIDCEKSTNTGEAAHICAKNPGGPRYNPLQTNEQRRHIDNALWLCGSCHSLVDTDWEHYSVEKLRMYKAQAEEFARKMQSAGLLLKNQLSQTKTECFDKRKYLVREYEKLKFSKDRFTMLLANHKKIETHVDFKTYEGETSSISIDQVVEKSQLCYLLGESGSGKTQSLWELHSSLCTANIKSNYGPCPVFLSTKSWSENYGLEAIVGDIFGAHFDSIDGELESGGFLFLIDGVNEIDAKTESKYYNELAKFISKYINNRFIISCRTPDFRQNLIPLSSYIKDGEIEDVFEISRLSKNQIRDYSNKYFSSSLDAEEFQYFIGLDSESAWNNENSSIHLARIPLFLQIYLETYKNSKEIPDSKAKLVRALVRIIVNRENSLNPFGYGTSFLEKTLSSFTYLLVSDHYGLRFPESVAKTKIAPIVKRNIDRYSESGNITLDVFWKKTISANFLRSYSDTEVEWLHQLLRDYFLGVEIADIWSNKEVSDENKMSTIRRGWDMALSIALETLSGSLVGAELLQKLIEYNKENFGDHAVLVFSGQSSDSRYRLAFTLIDKIVIDGDYETNLLNNIVEVLPFSEVVEALDESISLMKNSEMHPKLIEALSNMTIFHYEDTIVNREISGFYGNKITNIYATIAVKRGKEVLNRYLRHKDELLCFYAAKGLYSIDRSASVNCFKKLLSGKSDCVKRLVVELSDEWGMQ